ncbi:unnamed protein product [Phytophthora fragariaefolia]|uniref:Unnamed protein product n=1 Tax=Phytophthora fragariaefolia TaxID=1490495 RepID=A0A9W7D2Y3_9STRA|nr:unnamed protein product [Phytophthora fragariaefolia]
MITNDDDGEDVRNNKGETETNDEGNQAPVSDEPEEQYVAPTGDESVMTAEAPNPNEEVHDGLHRPVATAGNNEQSTSGMVPSSVMETATLAMALQQPTAVVPGLQAQVASTVATSGTQQLTSTPARDERHDGSQVVRGGQRTMPGSLRSVRAMTKRPDDDDDGSSSSSSDGSDDDGSGSSSEESSSRDDEHSDDEVSERRGRHERRHRERKRISTKRSVKDHELPTFAPSPKMSVSTWIDRVDLALKGAEESGRGKWSDRALYFIIGIS